MKMGASYSFNCSEKLQSSNAPISVQIFAVSSSFSVFSHRGDSLLMSQLQIPLHLLLRRKHLWLLRDCLSYSSSYNLRRSRLCSGLSQITNCTTLLTFHGPLPMFPHLPFQCLRSTMQNKETEDRVAPLVTLAC